MHDFHLLPRLDNEALLKEQPCGYQAESAAQHLQRLDCCCCHAPPSGLRPPLPQVKAVRNSFSESSRSQGSFADFSRDMI